MGKVMSGDGSDSISLIAGTNPHSAANGVYATCACAVIGKTAADNAFAAGFKKIAKFAPAIYSAEAFDATNTIIEELKMLASQKGGDDEHHPSERRHRPSHDRVQGHHEDDLVHVQRQHQGQLAIYVNQVEHGTLVQLGLE